MVMQDLRISNAFRCDSIAACKTKQVSIIQSIKTAERRRTSGRNNVHFDLKQSRHSVICSLFATFAYIVAKCINGSS